MRVFQQVDQYLLDLHGIETSGVGWQFAIEFEGYGLLQGPGEVYPVDALGTRLRQLGKACIAVNECLEVIRTFLDRREDLLELGVILLLEHQRSRMRE